MSEDKKGETIFSVTKGDSNLLEVNFYPDRKFPNFKLTLPCESVYLGIKEQMIRLKNFYEKNLPERDFAKQMQWALDELEKGWTYTLGFGLFCDGFWNPPEKSR